MEPPVVRSVRPQRLLWVLSSNTASFGLVITATILNNLLKFQPIRITWRSFVYVTLYVIVIYSIVAWEMNDKCRGCLLLCWLCYFIHLSPHIVGTATSDTGYPSRSKFDARILKERLFLPTVNFKRWTPVVLPSHRLYCITIVYRQSILIANGLWKHCSRLIMQSEVSSRVFQVLLVFLVFNSWMMIITASGVARGRGVMLETVFWSEENTCSISHIHIRTTFYLPLVDCHGAPSACLSCNKQL